MSLYIQNEIQIEAPIDLVWEALIDRDITVQYMYGCQIESNWEIGNTLNWIGKVDGITYVSGKLVEFDHEKVFSFTTFDPNGTYEDIPSNHLVVRYELEEINNKWTLLKVSQGDYQTVADGQTRYEDSIAEGGWSQVLENLKTILEE